MTRAQSLKPAAAARPQTTMTSATASKPDEVALRNKPNTHTHTPLLSSFSEHLFRLDLAQAKTNHILVEGEVSASPCGGLFPCVASFTAPPPLFPSSSLCGTECSSRKGQCTSDSALNRLTHLSDTDDINDINKIGS